MHPELGVGLPVRRLALRDLVLVVREQQIGTTTVDVQRVAQVLFRHRTALDMPTRAASAPRRLPRRLAGFGRLPERKILRRLLPTTDLNSRPGLIAVQAASGEASVVGEAPHPEIHIQTTGALRLDRRARVRVLPLLQRLHHRQDLGHCLGDAGLARGRRATEGRGILLHLHFHAPRQGLGALAALRGAADDLVVDVRDIANIVHGVASLPQVAGNDVEEYHDASVAQVAQVVHGHPTDVHVDDAGLQRGQLLLRPRHRIVDPKLRQPPFLALGWNWRLFGAARCIAGCSATLGNNGRGAGTGLTEGAGLLHHELEHVEEAVVSAWRQRCRDARGLDKFRLHIADLLHGAVTEAGYQQSHQALRDQSV
mmetsp:Transcript_67588/g.220000  ORF Transcript_67588/g.220000 Transcript_67588/m.220000 type:complete len:368 (-) Transcript_67588:603-1706(-)